MTVTAQPVEAVEMDDAELIRRSRDDPEQFAALFDRYVVGVEVAQALPELSENVSRMKIPC